MHWQRASADALEHAILAGVAATQDRFLVVGTRQNDDTTTSAMTWESTDGITWQATAVATPGRFTDVVAGPPALVAGGDLGQGAATFDHAVMLAAQTFNLNQVHGPLPLSVTAVASGPLGIVLSAQALPDKLQRTTWFLPNGTAEDAVETAEGLSGFDDLVGLSDRFIGLGHCPPLADCSASSFLAIGRAIPAAPVTTPSESQASPTPVATSADGPSALPTPRPLTEAAAVEAAVQADGRQGMRAITVASGKASELMPDQWFEWADVPSGDTWVWVITLSNGGPPLGAEGSFVVLDYFNGAIYGIQRWIS